MKTNMKVLIGVLALAVIGAAVYFSKNELQKGATRRPVGPQPDYEISSIIVDPANPVEGENFKISVVVKNKSSTTAATVPSKTLLHLSGQPLPIATTQPLGPLATEEEVWQTTSTQRKLLIRSCADADRAIAESNERNNCRERILDLLPPPLPPPPPPLPLCAEGQYTCDSWTQCSAEGSQTGTGCMVNSPGTCVIPLGPLTRACTPPPPPMPDLVIQNVTVTQDAQNGDIRMRTTIRNDGNLALVVSSGVNMALSAMTIDSAGRLLDPVRDDNILLCREDGICVSEYTIEPGMSINDSGLGRLRRSVWGGRSSVTGVRLTVDSRRAVTESNETNNTYDVAIPPEFLAWIAPPNLSIPPWNGVTMNPASPTAGSPVNFSAVISNNDSTTAPASITTLTVNGTGTSASLGEVYRQNVATPELTGGAIATVNFEWPSTIEGSYWPQVCADSENVISETAENDNCTRAYFTVAPAPPPPMPDLVIETVTLTQDPSSGEILATIMIRNIGTAAVNFTTAYPLRLSSNFSNNGSSTYIRENLLGPSGFRAHATAFTLPAGSALGNISSYVSPQLWVNTTDVRFTIDSRNVAAESNETNNTYDVAIPPEFLAWTPPPNLFIHWNSVTINPASPTAGSPVNFSAVISNTGSTTASASTATLTVSGTSTSGVPYEAYRQNISIPELSAANSATANFEWPSAIEGSYTSQICADSENVISEYSEYDNCGRAYRFGSSTGAVIVAPAPSE